MASTIQRPISPNAAAQPSPGASRRQLRREDSKVSAGATGAERTDRSPSPKPNGERKAAAAAAGGSGTASAGAAAGASGGAGSKSAQKLLVAGRTVKLSLAALQPVSGFPAPVNPLSLASTAAGAAPPHAAAAAEAAIAIPEVWNISRVTKALTAGGGGGGGGGGGAGSSAATAAAAAAASSAGKQAQTSAAAAAAAASAIASASTHHSSLFTDPEADSIVLPASIKAQTKRWMRITELYDPKFIAQNAANAAAGAGAGAGAAIGGSAATSGGAAVASAPAAAAGGLDAKHVSSISTAAAAAAALTDRTAELTGRSAATSDGRPGSSLLAIPKVDVRVVSGNGARANWSWPASAAASASASTAAASAAANAAPAKPKLCVPVSGSGAGHWSSLLAAVFNSIAAHSSLVPEGCYLWESIHGQDKNNVPKFNPSGRYTVRLFVLGEWRAVTIDDSIPVDSDFKPLLPVLSTALTMPSLALPLPPSNRIPLSSPGRGGDSHADAADAHAHAPATTQQQLATAKKDAAKQSKAEKERAETLLVEVWPLLLSKAILKLAAGEENLFGNMCWLTTALCGWQSFAFESKLTPALSLSSPQPIGGGGATARVANALPLPAAPPIRWTDRLLVPAAVAFGAPNPAAAAAAAAPASGAAGAASAISSPLLRAPTGNGGGAANGSGLSVVTTPVSAASVILSTAGLPTPFAALSLLPASIFGRPRTAGSPVAASIGSFTGANLMGSPIAATAAGGMTSRATDSPVPTDSEADAGPALWCMLIPALSDLSAPKPSVDPLASTAAFGKGKAGAAAAAKAAELKRQESKLGRGMSKRDLSSTLSAAGGANAAAGSKSPVREDATSGARSPSPAPGSKPGSASGGKRPDLPNANATPAAGKDSARRKDGAEQSLLSTTTAVRDERQAIRELYEDKLCVVDLSTGQSTLLNAEQALKLTAAGAARAGGVMQSSQQSDTATGVWLLFAPNAHAYQARVVDVPIPQFITPPDAKSAAAGLVELKVPFSCGPAALLSFVPPSAAVPIDQTPRLWLTVQANVFTPRTATAVAAPAPAANEPVPLRSSGAAAFSILIDRVEWYTNRRTPVYRYRSARRFHCVDLTAVLHTLAAADRGAVTPGSAAAAAGAKHVFSIRIQSEFGYALTACSALPFLLEAQKQNTGTATGTTVAAAAAAIAAANAPAANAENRPTTAAGGGDAKTAANTGSASVIPAPAGGGAMINANAAVGAVYADALGLYTYASGESAVVSGNGGLTALTSSVLYGPAPAHSWFVLFKYNIDLPPAPPAPASAAITSPNGGGNRPESPGKGESRRTPSHTSTRSGAASKAGGALVSPRLNGGGDRRSPRSSQIAPAAPAGGAAIPPPPPVYPKELHTAVSVDVHLDDPSLLPFVSVEWVCNDTYATVARCALLSPSPAVYLPPNQSGGYTLVATCVAPHPVCAARASVRVVSSNPFGTFRPEPASIAAEWTDSYVPNQSNIVFRNVIALNGAGSAHVHPSGLAQSALQVSVSTPATVLHVRVYDIDELTSTDIDTPHPRPILYRSGIKHVFLPALMVGGVSKDPNAQRRYLIDCRLDALARPLPPPQIPPPLPPLVAAAKPGTASGPAPAPIASPLPAANAGSAPAPAAGEIKWSIRALWNPTAAGAGGLSLWGDRTQSEEFAAIKANWEKNEKGRSAKARASRLLFLERSGALPPGSSAAANAIAGPPSPTKHTSNKSSVDSKHAAAMAAAAAAAAADSARRVFDPAAARFDSVKVVEGASGGGALLPVTHPDLKAVRDQHIEHAAVHKSGMDWRREQEVFGTRRESIIRFRNLHNWRQQTDDAIRHTHAIRAAHRTRLQSHEQLLASLKDAIDMDSVLRVLPPQLATAVSAAPPVDTKRSGKKPTTGGAGDAKERMEKTAFNDTKDAAAASAAPVVPRSPKAGAAPARLTAAAREAAAAADAAAAKAKEEFTTVEANALNQYLINVRVAMERCTNPPPAPAPAPATAATTAPAVAVAGSTGLPPHVFIPSDAASDPSALAQQQPAVPLWKAANLLSLAYHRMQQAVVLSLRQALGLPSATHLLAAGANAVHPPQTLAALAAANANASSSGAAPPAVLPPAPIAFTRPEIGQLSLPRAQHSGISAELHAYRTVMAVAAIVTVAHKSLPAAPPRNSDVRVDPVAAEECGVWLDTCTSVVKQSALVLLDNLLSYVSSTPGAPGSGTAPPPLPTPIITSTSNQSKADKLEREREAAAAAAAQAAAIPALATVAGANPDDTDDTEVVLGLLHVVETFPTMDGEHEEKLIAAARQLVSNLREEENARLAAAATKPGKGAKAKPAPKPVSVPPLGSAGPSGPSPTAGTRTLSKGGPNLLKP